MENNNNIENKQSLVNEEITVKGYNLDMFIIFLKTKKGQNGDNLENWTYEELQTAIADFHSQYQPNPLITSAIKSTDLAQSTRLTTNFYSINEDINCKSIEQNQLTNLDNLKINLLFPEKSKNDENYDKKFTITFLLDIFPLKTQLRRRHQDFYWLKTTLSKLYPGYFIPPILEKDLSDSDSDMIITKRMTDCYNFINEICKDNILRSSKVFYDFVTTEKEKEFQIKRKYYNSLEKPKLVEDMITELGVVTLDGSIFGEGQKFDKNKNYMKKNMEILSKLIDRLKTLIKDFDTVNKSIKLVGESFNELLTQSYTFPENTKLIKSFHAIKNLMLDWAYSEQRKKTIFELNIRQYFKYLNREYDSIKELYNNFEETKEDYLKNKKNLEKEKESLFKKKNVKNWGLPPELANIDVNNKELCYEKMLPKETLDVENKRKLACFYGNNFEKEFVRLRNRIELNTSDVFNDFYKNSSKEINEQVEMWEKFKNFENLVINIENKDAKK